MYGFLERSSFLALCVVLFIGVSMTNTEAFDDVPAPPLSPAGERVIPEDTAFAESFLSIIRQHPYFPRWVFGTAIFTHTEEFGTIWRVDYKMPEITDPSMINRIICWKNEKGDPRIMYAIGQLEPPL